jgi:hypothetical protein
LKIPLHALVCQNLPFQIFLFKIYILVKYKRLYLSIARKRCLFIDGILKMFIQADLKDIFQLVERKGITFVIVTKGQ